MTAIAGLIVVLSAVLGGFAMANGPFGVLLAWSEWVVICGTGVGIVMVSTPGPVLKMLMNRLPRAFKGGEDQSRYLDTLKLLYELFQLARKDGLIAIESHIENPDKSAIFAKYPNVAADHHMVEFLCDALRTVLGGSVSPYDLEAMLDLEIETHHAIEEKPIAALHRLSDALPGIGIVAAVLGIVVTMQALAGPVEEIGHHVGSALVGTFLGILLSYGFVSPIAANLEARVQDEGRLYNMVKAGVIAFSKNLPPMVAVEFARKALGPDTRPSFLEMEAACKETRKAA